MLDLVLTISKYHFLPQSVTFCSTTIKGVPSSAPYPKHTLSLITSFKLFARQVPLEGILLHKMLVHTLLSASLSTLDTVPGSYPPPLDFAPYPPVWVINLWSHQRSSSWVLTLEFNLGRELPHITVMLQWYPLPTIFKVFYCLYSIYCYEEVYNP